MASSLITSWQIVGEKMETVTVFPFIFLGSNINADSDCSLEIKTLAPWNKSYYQTRQHIKKHRHYFADKGLCSQSYGFSPLIMYDCWLDRKKGWAPKNWCLLTVGLEKTFESPLDCKEIKPVNPKGNQPWIFIGRTEAEASILWPPDVKSRLIGKEWNAGKYWKGEGDGR